MSDDDRRRVDRRTFLTATGTGAAVALAGCTGGSDSPAKLTDAFFRVTQGGDVRFALVYDERPDPDELNPEETLNVGADRATVVHDDGVSLDWFANVMGSEIEVQDRAGASAISQFDGESPADEDVFPDLEKVLKGRIEDGALLPSDRDDETRPKFRGGATRFPSIEYAKDEVTGADRRVHVQFTDGYVYHFPRNVDADGLFPMDARYDLVPAARKVHNVGREDQSTPGETVELSDLSTIPYVYEDASHLVAEFDHKSHPLLGALKAVAQRRQAALTRVSSTIATDTVDEYVERVREQTQTSVASIVTTIGPSPVKVEDEAQTSYDITKTVTRKNLPAVALAVSQGASMSGRVAAEIGGAAAHSWDLYNTARSLDRAVGHLEEWGRTIGDSPDGMTEAALTRELNYDGLCGDRDGPQCSDPNREGIEPLGASTPEAVVALSAFQARLGVNALGSGGDVRQNATAYVRTLQEVKRQCEYLATAVDKVAKGGTFDEKLLDALMQAETFYRDLGDPSARTMLDAEVGMVAQVLADFTRDECRSIRERWSDGTYEPEWTVASSSAEGFEAEVVADETTDRSELALTDVGQGNGGRIQWSRATGGWEGRWSVWGVFEVPDADSLSGSQAHWFELVPGDGNDNLLAQIGLGTGEGRGLRLLGSLVSDSGDAAVEFPSSGTGPYGYRVTHDGDGGYVLGVTPLEGGGQQPPEATGGTTTATVGEETTVSASGSAPSGVARAALGLDSQGDTATVRHAQFARDCNPETPPRPK